VGAHSAHVRQTFATLFPAHTIRLKVWYVESSTLYICITIWASE